MKDDIAGTHGQSVLSATNASRGAGNLTEKVAGKLEGWRGWREGPTPGRTRTRCVQVTVSPTTTIRCLNPLRRKEVLYSECWDLYRKVIIKVIASATSLRSARHRCNLLLYLDGIRVADTIPSYTPNAVRVQPSSILNFLTTFFTCHMVAISPILYDALRDRQLSINQEQAPALPAVADHDGELELWLCTRSRPLQGGVDLGQLH
jgi:hypothetical protein